MTTPPLSGYALAAQIAQLEAQGFLVTGMTVEKANGWYSIHYAEVSKNPPQQPELFTPPKTQRDISESPLPPQPY